ncbi:MAG TPA: carbon starvation CstA family protein [Thermoanaerobaculia bacterium]|jgi:carbon starvation protein|nr:carbon starvation CstA family protein [Thermoanaerobaculia bacterium]
MQLTVLAVVFLAAIALAYRVYGSWIARLMGLDARAITPAREKEDGVDYVPTKPFYLFGQHFAAIAAAGPIAGPIIACQEFGWLPCLLWIGIGVVLIGAVHDFMALAASVRHGARSIADITREHLGRRAGIAMMAFIWLALVYVIVAFADITAGSFVTGTEELATAAATFHPGGAVAAASIFYLLLAVVMGFIQRYLDPPLWLLTVIFVPATFVAVWLGTQVSTYFILDAKWWALLILAYCCVASMVPVWSLLQPRGYLGGFILYFALALGIIGIFFGGYEIKQEAFKAFDTGKATGLLFPFLFVTIACGACSGFHGLVCSGTTSKQIDKETDIRPIGYGGMLAEAFVALIAMVTVMIVAQGDLKGLKPGTIYGNGIGNFLTLIIGEKYRNFAITFGAMAFSTFVFDTVDVSTRLGRYIVQELFRWPTRFGAWVGTLLTVALPVYFVAFAPPGSWVKFWTLFGASNQLLAALTLLAITVWLHQRRQQIAFTLIPMLFVLVTTLYALVRLTIQNFSGAIVDPVAMVNGITSAALIALAVYLVIMAIIRLRVTSVHRNVDPVTSA